MHLFAALLIESYPFFSLFCFAKVWRGRFAQPALLAAHLGRTGRVSISEATGFAVRS